MADINVHCEGLIEEGEVKSRYLHSSVEEPLCNQPTAHKPTHHSPNFKNVNTEFLVDISQETQAQSNVTGVDGAGPNVSNKRFLNNVFGLNKILADRAKKRDCGRRCYYTVVELQ